MDLEASLHNDFVPMLSKLCYGNLSWWGVSGGVKLPTPWSGCRKGKKKGPVSLQGMPTMTRTPTRTHFFNFYHFPVAPSWALSLQYHSISDPVYRIGHCPVHSTLSVSKIPWLSIMI